MAESIPPHRRRVPIALVQLTSFSTRADAPPLPGLPQIDIRAAGVVTIKGAAVNVN